MKRSGRMKLALAAGSLGVVFTDIPSSLARYHLPVPCLLTAAHSLTFCRGYSQTILST